jgi:hypothetical protein
MKNPPCPEFQVRDNPYLEASYKEKDCTYELGDNLESMLRQKLIGIYNSIDHNRPVDKIEIGQKVCQLCGNCTLDKSLETYVQTDMVNGKHKKSLERYARVSSRKKKKKSSKKDNENVLTAKQTLEQRYGKDVGCIYNHCGK